MSANCHKLLRETARKMAAAVYDELAAKNEWYAKAKAQGLTQNRYVNRSWPLFIAQAKATLVDMLKGNYPESLKNEIADALILDNSLPKGRKSLVGRPH